MMGLLLRIAVFLAAAFLLGLVVGYLAWGYGRHAVPAALWRARERERAALAERAADAERRTVAAQQDAETQRRELARFRDLLGRAWSERDELAQRLQWLEREGATLRVERDRAVGRVELLQRRLAELSIARARTSGVPPAMVPGGPGAAPAPDARPLQPADPAALAPAPGPTSAGASVGGPRPAVPSGSARGVVIDLRAENATLRSRVAPPALPAQGLPPLAGTFRAGPSLEGGRSAVAGGGVVGGGVGDGVDGDGLDAQPDEAVG